MTMARAIALAVLAASTVAARPASADDETSASAALSCPTVARVHLADDVAARDPELGRRLEELVSRQSARTACPSGAVPGATRRVDVDVARRGESRLQVAVSTDSPRPRRFARDLGEGASRSVTREEVLLVVSPMLDALDLPDAPAQAAAREAGPRTQTTLCAGASAGLARIADTAVVPRGAVSLEVLSSKRMGLGLGLTGIYTAPGTISGAEASVTVSAVGARLAPRLSVAPLRAVSIGVAVGGGLDVVAMRPETNGLAAAVVATDKKVVAAVGTAAIDLRWALANRLELTFACGADADAVSRSLVEDHGRERVRVGALPSVRPYASLGVSIPLVGFGGR